MSPDLARSFRQFASILPVASAIGIGLGVIYDWGYFSAFDIRFFFLIGLADHTMSAVIWMLGAFAFIGMAVATNIIDDIELGIDRRGRFYDYARVFGATWLRNLSFLSVIVLWVLAGFWTVELSSVVALAFVITGLSHYMHIRYVRHERGQPSSLPDLYILVVAVGFAAYFAGISNFHRDIRSEPQTIVDLGEKQFGRVVLLRATSDGVIIYKPAQQVYEFVRSASIERIRIKHDKPKHPEGKSRTDTET